MSKKEEAGPTDADTAAQLKARLDRWQTYQNTENAADRAPIAVVPSTAAAAAAAARAAASAYPWAEPPAASASRETRSGSGGATAAATAPPPPVTVVLPAYRGRPRQRQRVPLPDSLSAAALPEENRSTEVWSAVAFAVVVLAFILGIVAILAHFFWKT